MQSSEVILRTFSELIPRLRRFFSEFTNYFLQTKRRIARCARTRCFLFWSTIYFLLRLCPSIVWPHDAGIIEPRRLHVLALVEQLRTVLMVIDRFDTEMRFCAT